MRRFLEITLDGENQTAQRIGAYNAVTAPVQFDVVRWFKKEGEKILGLQDVDSGTIEGEDIVELNLEESGKGISIITARGWEIGATLVQILEPAGKKGITVDLRKEPMRLAVLEVPDTVAEKRSSFEVAEQIKTAPPCGTRLARECAEALGVPLPENNGEIVRMQDVLDKHMSQPLVPREQDAVLAAPYTRGIAKDLGVSLNQVKGSGPDGIIRECDVRAAAAARVASSVTEPGTSIESPKDIVEAGFYIPPQRQLVTASALEFAWVAPHASPGIDINPVPLVEMRARMREDFEKLHGVKLRYEYFVVRACAWLLTRPEFHILNARWFEKDSGDVIELYQDVNIGIAVGILPPQAQGRFSDLVIPVIKDAPRRSLAGIAKKAEALIREAVSGKPRADNLAGLTFTVNNTGNPIEWNGMRFAGDEDPDPVIPRHTAAILAFGAIREVGGVQLMKFRLRFDHRVVQGHEPKMFLRALQHLLERPEQILALG